MTNKKIILQVVSVSRRKQLSQKVMALGAQLEHEKVEICCFRVDPVCGAA